MGASALEIQQINQAASRFGVDPRLIYAEYGKESSWGATGPKDDPFWQMGLISGPRGYHYGYDAVSNTLPEAFKVDASIWAYDKSEMQTLKMPVTMDSLIRFHEARFTPVGASNDPQGLNNNAVSLVTRFANEATPIFGGQPIVATSQAGTTQTVTTAPTTPGLNLLGLDLARIGKDTQFWAIAAIVIAGGFALLAMSVSNSVGFALPAMSVSNSVK